MGDDDLAVEPVEFSDDYLEGHAEIRLRGPRVGLIPILHCISNGSARLWESDLDELRLFAAIAISVLDQIGEQGWSPEELAERIETNFQAVDTRDVPGMVEVELVDDG